MIRLKSELEASGVQFRRPDMTERARGLRCAGSATGHDREGKQGQWVSTPVLPTWDDGTSGMIGNQTMDNKTEEILFDRPLNQLNPNPLEEEIPLDSLPALTWNRRIARRRKESPMRREARKKRERTQFQVSEKGEDPRNQGHKAKEKTQEREGGAKEGRRSEEEENNGNQSGRRTITNSHSCGGSTRNPTTTSIRHHKSKESRRTRNVQGRESIAKAS